MSREILRLEGVSKKFGGEYVLRDINLSLEEGEALGILGGSGSGKSVLINMIRGSREYRPDEGKIIYFVTACDNCKWIDIPSKEGDKCPRCGGTLRYREVDIWGSDDRTLLYSLRRRLGIMLQRTFALYGEKSSLENVIEALDSLELYQGNYIMEKAIELLKMVNMNHRAITPARDLSGGEKQRIILARQLAIDPILLLLDDPTGTLDPHNTRLIIDILKNFVKGKRSMILTSHLPEVLRELSSRVIWLEKGRIESEGTADEIISNYVGQIEVRKIIVEISDRKDILRLKDVKKYYYSIIRGIVKAVDGVSLTVGEGEIFGILGPSGSGKTTLARIISGIIEPTEGEVFVRIGDDWVDMKQPGSFGRGRAAPYIGVLHQEYSLYPYRSVLQNLTESIGLAMPPEFAKFRAIDILTGIGFGTREAEALLKKNAEELSEGERHRVALAQILIREPKILILDEPSGTMNPTTKAIVSDTLRKAKEEFNATILIVTHDMDFALMTCERSALMLEGKILEVGDTEEIVRRLVELRAEVIGVPLEFIERYHLAEKASTISERMGDSSCL
ncbi:MAG: methyl coenzyme M reductase system, component A2 [Candidatus Korarchaeum sp.]|nr:methyl coenzyme M reductase system, component A2 [Candidatus Korarchaeum sp.]